LVRKIYVHLVDQKETQARKPIILKGVRQVCKTYILKVFAEKSKLLNEGCVALPHGSTFLAACPPQEGLPRGTLQYLSYWNLIFIWYLLFGN
jgi:hypothetical protein